MVIVIHGPKGCGKTRNKHELARACGATSVYDDENPPSAAALLRDGGQTPLILTTPEHVDDLKARYMRMPGGVRLLPYATAAKRAGVK